MTTTTTATTNQAGPDPVQEMLAEVIQTAREEGRKAGLRSARNTVLALHRQAVQTESKFQRDPDVSRYTSGQQDAYETLGGWIAMELDEEGEES